MYIIIFFNNNNFTIIEYKKIQKIGMIINSNFYKKKYPKCYWHDECVFYFHFGFFVQDYYN